jgi:hypothetical protein
MGHWASWFFEVDRFNSTAFWWTKGGFQSARGNRNGGEFYVENVFEELDGPNEFYYDTASTPTPTLYYFHNCSTPTVLPPTATRRATNPAAAGAPTALPADPSCKQSPSAADLQFAAPHLKELMRIEGVGTAATDITVRGIGFRDTTVTYLEPHGMPSGGDWALQRTAAVFVTHAERIAVDACSFERLDGNGIMFSGYVRNASLTRSEFTWTGGTAIAQWGDTEGTGANASLYPKGMGWDGRGGMQPRGTTVAHNLVHELGIWEKQSAAYFQAKACLTNLEGNIFYNGPRAGINFNDGFGGGNAVQRNLIFNFCRESGDHGPINVWDRQLYVSGLPGTASDNSLPFKLWDELSHNFILANYNSQEAVDTDDGSSYYHVHHNLFVYGNGGLKSDYGGHDNVHHDNVYAFITHGKCVSIEPQKPGHADGFFSNYCVFQTRPDWTPGYAEYYCSTTSPNSTDVYELPLMHDNQVWQQGANGSVRCMQQAFHQHNWTTLEEWQRLGHDQGTVVKNVSDLDVGWLLQVGLALVKNATTPRYEGQIY